MIEIMNPDAARWLRVAITLLVLLALSIAVMVWSTAIGREEKAEDVRTVLEKIGIGALMLSVVFGGGMSVAALGILWTG